jgi:hypothetical protein
MSEAELCLAYQRQMAVTKQALAKRGCVGGARITSKCPASVRHALGNEETECIMMVRGKQTIF